MYVPSHHRMDDRAQQLAFMRQYSFAALVTAGSAGAPLATHLPFLAEERRGALFLVAHMARANPQWQGFGAGEAPVIFQGPLQHQARATAAPPVPIASQALCRGRLYLAQPLYAKAGVPTWDYAAVHANGLPRLLEGETQLQAL